MFNTRQKFTDTYGYVTLNDLSESPNFWNKESTFVNRKALSSKELAKIINKNGF